MSMCAGRCPDRWTRAVTLDDFFGRYPSQYRPATAPHQFMTENSQSLMAYCCEHGRVCPLPPRWVELWELLPERVQVGAGWQPPLPLILAAWHDCSDLQKRLRLAEHIEWAEKRGTLPTVASFLRSLAETDWHHQETERARQRPRAVRGS